MSVPPHLGWFDEGADFSGLPVELLIIERVLDQGPAWHAAGALVKEPGSAPTWLPGRVDPYWTADAPVMWEYICDKGGGNGYNWEVAFLRIGAVTDAEPVTAHLDAALRRSGHPLGFFATTTALDPVDPADPVEAEEEPVTETTEPGVHHEEAGIEAPFAVKDVLTWRLVCELVRRHPARLWPMRTFPMDGFYDCLTLRELHAATGGGPFIHLNRHGQNTLVARFDGRNDEQQLIGWTTPFWSGDVHGWLRKIEQAAGLTPPVGGLPPSTSSSIAVRWISAFLSAQLGSRTSWDASMLWDVPEYDTPIGKEIRSWAAAGQSVRGRVWLLTATEHAVAVTADGRLLRSAREPVPLLSTYHAHGRSVTRLLGATVADLLP